MSEPANVLVRIYREAREVVVRIESSSVEVQLPGVTAAWEGGRVMEMETKGPCDDSHIISAVTAALQTFRRETA